MPPENTIVKAESGALAEVVGEQRAGVLALGAGQVEAVREQVVELRAEDARDGCQREQRGDEPRRGHGVARTLHGVGEADHRGLSSSPSLAGPATCTRSRACVGSGYGAASARSTTSVMCFSISASIASTASALWPHSSIRPRSGEEQRVALLPALELARLAVAPGSLREWPTKR